MKREDHKYLKCTSCRWVYVIDPALPPADDSCIRCGTSNSFFVSTDGREVPLGSTIQGIAAPLSGHPPLNKKGTVKAD